jgi:hypothetical protein
MLSAHPLAWKRTVVALLLFGTAFGYLEAAVVSYLRMLHEPARQQFYPGRPTGDLFPLLTLDQLRASGAQQPRILAIEIGREAATLLMLAAVALAVGQNAGQWAAAFVIAFGVWDITFYLFLKLLLDWPASLFTWDILFLVPVPWTGPVLAPVLVSATMITGGIWHLRSEAHSRPIRLAARHWTGLLSGAASIVLSFAFDYRHIMAGGTPHGFHWTIFALGIATGAASYLWAVDQSRHADRSVLAPARRAEVPLSEMAPRPAPIPAASPGRTPRRL